MPSPSSPPGPNLPLSCSSASSSEEDEDREGDYDDEDEDDYEDEEADPVGQAVHRNAETQALAGNPSVVHSPFVSGDETQKNGTVAAGSKRSISDDASQEEGKRLRTSSMAVTPATPLSVALSLPAQVHPGDATEIHGKEIVSVGDDSRRLFQRLWTDEDEIGLLKGFYEYSRRGNGSYHEKAPFYDQVKASLQFDYNKNQLVEKLRRLKKKYRNIVKKLDTGKDFAFKTAHDQLTFEISKKIWDTGFPTAGDDDDEEPMAEQKSVRASKKFRTQASKRTPPPPPSATDGGGNRVEGVATASVGGGSGNADLRNNCHIPPVSVTVEETVRSCLLPVIKELMCCRTANWPVHTGFGLGMNPLPLSFGCAGEFKGKGSEEKWRKQQIMELEVYLKRMELVQEQIKLTLQELKSMDT